MANLMMLGQSVPKIKKDKPEKNSQFSAKHSDAIDVMPGQLVGLGKKLGL